MTDPSPLAAGPRLGLQPPRRGPVAQGIEQQPSKLKVAGSNPAGVANEFKMLTALPFNRKISEMLWGNAWGNMRRKFATHQQSG
jgi:hypothetical protein